jgi:hypothetical protein
LQPLLLLLLLLVSQMIDACQQVVPDLQICWLLV